MTPTPIPGLSREKTSWIFDGAMQALGGVVPNSTQTHVNRHGTEFEVEISICLRPEDLPAFLRNLDRNATHIKAPAYLESHIFDDGLIGSIVTTADITDRVEARLEEMRRRRSP